MPQSFREAMRLIGVPTAQFESGTEDMPDAYRFVPEGPAEQDMNIVMEWCRKTTKEWG